VIDSSCLAQVDDLPLEQLLLPMLDDSDRIVRASSALSCGLLGLEASGEKLAYLWRNDPIKDVRESALSAMRAVGGEVIEGKLRVEKALSRHLEDFRVELERKSYQASIEDIGSKRPYASISNRKLQNVMATGAPAPSGAGSPDWHC